MDRSNKKRFQTGGRHQKSPASLRGPFKCNCKTQQKLTVSSRLVKPPSSGSGWRFSPSDEGESPVLRDRWEDFAANSNTLPQKSVLPCRKVYSSKINVRCRKVYCRKNQCYLAAKSTAAKISVTLP